MAQKEKKESGWIGTLVYCAIIILIVVLLRTFVFSPMKISGHSMDPTLHDGERVISVKLAKVKRFDIVTLKAPDDPDKDYVKRVIGLPGDTIKMQNDTLYINGKKYNEPYLDDFKKLMKKGTLASQYEPMFQPEVENAKHFTENFSLQTLASTKGAIKVPKDTYFVMGDNRLISKDSRMLGFIPKKNILGVVEFVYWPLKDIGFVH
ncbi:signal peptidase I [Catellicoccus marimammalium]|uniref:Signal peptidase I n=1 Tax=Catellicoccus marimammalium M35/04/3 TaxID=1234409 RepID=K8Z8N8_9ENTE|nr:signal peptidase I [Catellicoccus marimammalium]EKU27414.1 Signal peptidase I [Catellicoccus marimammalium M35/04/3]